MWRRAPGAQLILWIEVFGGVVLPAHASLWGTSIRCMGEMSSSPDMCFAWTGRFSKKARGFDGTQHNGIAGEETSSRRFRRRPIDARTRWGSRLVAYQDAM